MKLKEIGKQLLSWIVALILICLIMGGGYIIGRMYAPKPEAVKYEKVVQNNSNTSLRIVMDSVAYYRQLLGETDFEVQRLENSYKYHKIKDDEYFSLYSKYNDHDVFLKWKAIHINTVKAKTKLDEASMKKMSYTKLYFQTLEKK